MLLPSGTYTIVLFFKMHKSINLLEILNLNVMQWGKREFCGRNSRKEEMIVKEIVEI